MDTDSRAIEVTGANRFYGSLHVLKDLEMNVPHGCMYVLCSYSCTNNRDTLIHSRISGAMFTIIMYSRKGSCILIIIMLQLVIAMILFVTILVHNNYVMYNTL